MEGIKKRIELLEKEKRLLEDIVKLREKLGEGQKRAGPYPAPYPVYPYPVYPCPTVTCTDSTGEHVPKGAVITCGIYNESDDIRGPSYV